MSEETKRKIGIAQFGRKNEKQVEAMRLTNIGNKRLVGYRQTDEHIKNMVATKYKNVFCVTNNTEYPSPTDAADKLKISRFGIYNVIAGRRNHVGGYKFKYA